eukprot:Nk52_evm19s157 gene=Nk52_evmTU19s157
MADDEEQVAPLPKKSTIVNEAPLTIARKISQRPDLAAILANKESKKPVGVVAVETIHVDAQDTNIHKVIYFLSHSHPPVEVSDEEIAQIAEEQSLTEGEVKDFHTAFEVFGNSQVMKRKEIFSIFHSLNMDISVEQVDKVVNASDEEKSALKLSFPDFVAMMVEHATAGNESAGLFNAMHILQVGVTKAVSKKGITLGEVHRYYQNQSRKSPHVLEHFVAGARLVGLTQGQLHDMISRFTHEFGTDKDAQETEEDFISPYGLEYMMPMLLFNVKKQKYKIPTSYLTRNLLMQVEDPYTAFRLGRPKSPPPLEEQLIENQKKAKSNEKAKIRAELKKFVQNRDAEMICTQPKIEHRYEAAAPEGVSEYYAKPTESEENEAEDGANGAPANPAGGYRLMDTSFILKEFGKDPTIDMLQGIRSSIEYAQTRRHKDRCKYREKSCSEFWKKMDMNTIHYARARQNMHSAFETYSAMKVKVPFVDKSKEKKSRNGSATDRDGVAEGDPSPTEPSAESEAPAATSEEPVEA